jgi:hypothetical protein
MGKRDLIGIWAIITNMDIFYGRKQGRIILLALFCLTGCDSMCGSDPIHSQVSPDGRLKAVAYLYDCGATTGFSTQVSVIDADDEITSSGNILIVDGKRGLNVKWLSDTKLLISNSAGHKTYKKVDELGSVKVSYE